MTCLGILITGGKNKTSGLSSVEFYVPQTNQTWSLPHMGSIRVKHSQNEFLACGGDTSRSCELFNSSSGLWSSFNLLENRYGHTSWTFDNETVLLLGGIETRNSTEMIDAGKRAVKSFFSLSEPS